MLLIESSLAFSERIFDSQADLCSSWQSLDEDAAMKVICKAGKTGKPGDGRIFVSPVEMSGKARIDEVFTGSLSH